MEIGSAGLVLGFSRSKEAASLSTRSRRLVRESVAELDAKYK
jgi:hypothetical protein